MGFDPNASEWHTLFTRVPYMFYYDTAAMPQLPVCTYGPFGGNSGHAFSDRYSAMNGPITAIKIRWASFIYGRVTYII